MNDARRTISRTDEAGFSLVEVLVSLAVLAIAVSIVGFSLSNFSAKARERQVVDSLVNDLRTARRVALQTGRPHPVIFDVDNRSFHRHKGEVHRLPEGMEFQILSAGEAVSATGQPAIVFLPNGANTGGRIDLQGATGIRSIRTDWLTGEIVISEGAD